MIIAKRPRRYAHIVYCHRMSNNLQNIDVYFLSYTILKCVNLHRHTLKMSHLIGFLSWAEALVKIARMTLTIKLDRNWSSFQLANSAPPLSVTDSAIAPSARMHHEWVL